jgi:Spx/MgsR family transcriptional regulator
MGEAAITLYGIANCDSVRKARKWLAERGVDYRFHDFRKDGLDERQLRAWVAELGWEALLNRRGSTWRKLPESVRAGMDEAAAVRVMLEQPAIIKRPLLDLGGERRIGFSPAGYGELFA